MKTDKAIEVLAALRTEHNSELTDEAIDLAVYALLERDLLRSTLKSISICINEVEEAILKRQ